MSNKENTANECPGALSSEAGKSSACFGCPNQRLCVSAKLKEPDTDIPLIKSRFDDVRHTILVLSGKGGVGKSTVTTMLARSLAKHDDINVAVLDLDICGPSIPRMFGVEGKTLFRSGSDIYPLYVQDNLAVVSVGFLLETVDSAVIWRGSRKNALIKQFLRDVVWDEIDYLIVDMPPGTSDEHLSFVQLTQSCSIDGAIIVTTPQEIALLDVRKEINFCKKLKVPIIGLVENMVYFVCPKCQTKSEIFSATTGGAELLSQATGSSLLARIPLDLSIARCCDEGRDYLDEYADSEIALVYAKFSSVVKDLVEG